MVAPSWIEAGKLSNEVKVAEFPGNKPGMFQVMVWVLALEVTLAAAGNSFKWNMEASISAVRL